MQFGVKTGKVSIRPANMGDKRELANLIHFETYVHRHLDWRTPLEWIGSQPFIVSERQEKILSALACPPDPPNIAWIRLLAISSSISLQDGWRLLWEETKNILMTNPSIKILAIPLQSWFKTLLESSKFNTIGEVVVLVWEGRVPLEIPKNDIKLRPMSYGDLPKISEIDRSAFDDEWRNSKESIEVAFRQASVATVAGYEDEVLGYQISTGGSLGGHLARLAVRKDFQMKGIGYLLVQDLLDQFEKKGVSRVTVNTQQDNIASLRLYKKAGFRDTGEVFPVYQYMKGK